MNKMQRAEAVLTDLGYHASTDYRVWIGCMGAYNGGDLVGDWIDAEDAHEMVGQLTAKWQEIGGYDWGDEWFIADHEGFGYAWPGGENPDLEALPELVWALQEHGEALEAWLGGCQGREIGDFQDRYAGETDGNLKDWVWDWLEDTGYFADWTQDQQFYFNIEAYTEDFKLQMEVIELNGTTYIFYP
tara:strand:+ start:1202 stop:1762 length:561 start_codon:yes stop_codon:yes gene_type:complete